MKMIKTCIICGLLLLAMNCVSQDRPDAPVPVTPEPSTLLLGLMAITGFGVMAVRKWFNKK